MARNLLLAGFPLLGWNRSALSAALTEGIPLAAGLEDAVRSEILLLMLLDSAAVGDTLERLDASLRAGQLVLDMGSSDPVDSRERANRLAARGIGWVDAPVSGGAGGAAAATLAIMAGGTAEDFERARSVLEALGGNVVHVGGPGAGHTAKVVNQVIVGITHEAVAEGIALAEAAGIDPCLVQRALRGGWADSKVLQDQGRRMIDRNFAPGGRVRTLRKDLLMASALADRLRLDLPYTREALHLVEELIARGDGELDMAAIYRLREPSSHSGPS